MLLVEIIILILILLLLIFIFFLLLKEKTKPFEMENLIYKIWKESGIDEKIGQINLHSFEIKKTFSSLEKLLSSPIHRGHFWEIALENILNDQLPPDMYGIRQEMPWGKRPDAFIKSTAGIICIDSKFPLENYKKMIEVEENQREYYKKQFMEDVKKHLNKIKQDYIMPEKGTANFAFAFIPSESIYYFLINEAYEILRNYALEGVLVVSPLTISSKIELIKAGIHSRKLTEEAEKILENIKSLGKNFEELYEKWRIFNETHLRGLVKKAEEIDKSYSKIREQFDKIKK